MSAQLNASLEHLENACHALHAAMRKGDLDPSLYQWMNGQIYRLENKIKELTE